MPKIVLTIDDEVFRRIDDEIDRAQKLLEMEKLSDPFFA